MDEAATLSIWAVAYGVEGFARLCLVVVDLLIKKLTKREIWLFYLFLVKKLILAMGELALASVAAVPDS